jgi:dipeptidyl aminopeptidase/acylaminoacyl peptidase
LNKVTSILALVLFAAAPVCAYDSSPDLSPDNTLVAFVRTDDAGQSPTIVVSPIDDPACRAVCPGRQPQFSPDGEYILCTVDGSSRAVPAVWKKYHISDAYTDICVAKLDGTDTRQLTNFGGASPAWSTDGGEIAYVTSSGALCRLSISGGTPATIARKVPCFSRLTWLADLKSLVATMQVKGKLARYAFTPPSTTPVRISPQHSVPANALVPYLSESGKKTLYMVRKALPPDEQAIAGFELWGSWIGGKRKVADIVPEAPVAAADMKQLSIALSADERLAAVACAGKVWVVELSSGKTTLISGPLVQPASADAQPAAPQTEVSPTPGD